MGLLADTFDAIAALLPERKIAIGAAVQTWEHGTPQLQKESYYRFALEGYSRNELVYACVEEIATSAAEPRIAAMRNTPDGPEQVKDHEILHLFEHPNPFMSRYQLIATALMYRGVAGNAYFEKVRSASGKVVELWPLRPDRMWVIPDRVKHIRGWEYRLGAEVHFLDARDVIQTRARNPLDDWYGLPPMAVAGARIDTDSAMRAFTGAFFRNAGVPAGLLNITKSVGQAERQMIRDRFRGEVGGPSGWHSLLVLDNTEASYTAMGMPLGERGLVMPELDEISEARIPMVYGVPLELIGARLGMIHGNRSTTKEARAGFWDETLAPIYQEMAADLSTGLVDEFSGFDYLEFDLSTVKALAEDEDAKHTRIREDVKTGLLSVQEGRAALGKDPEYEADAILMLPDNLSPVLASEMLAPPPPAPGALGLPAPGANGQNGTNGSLTPREQAVLSR